MKTKAFRDAKVYQKATNQKGPIAVLIRVYQEALQSPRLDRYRYCTTLQVTSRLHKKLKASEIADQRIAHF